MIDPEAKVKQWSFCPTCKGRGCKDCGNSGKVESTILFSDLPKPARSMYLYQLGKEEEEESA